MADIVFFATSESIRKAALMEAAKFDADIGVVVVDTQSLFGIYHREMAEGARVIVSRGLMISYMESQGLGWLPMVDCPLLSGEDFAILSEIKQLLGKARPVISSTARAKDELERYLGVKLVGQQFESYAPEDIEQEVDRLVALGCDAIVVGHTMYGRLLELNPPIPIFPNDSPFRGESIFQGFTYATQLLREIKQQERARSELQSMVDLSFDAVVYLAPDGRIISLNPKAHQLFYPMKLTEGMHLSALFEGEDYAFITRLMEGGESTLGQAVHVRDSVCIMNVACIAERGEPVGYILYLSEYSRIEELSQSVRSEYQQKGHVARYRFANIVGSSPAVSRVKGVAEQYAGHDATVLLTGESGTGKELFAQSIHNASLRGDRPFVGINCAAIPMSLLESELFGYVEGAFTGADKRGKKGLFEVADGGTIFLDEISEMDYQGQTRLLRVLAEKSIIRVGDDRIRPVDVRVIVATNRDLPAAVAEGTFREDLYYRLNVLSLRVPPLRERGRDMVEIFEMFLAVYGQSERKHLLLSKGAEAALMSLPWPGNVRQLRNFCMRVVILAQESEITADFLTAQYREAYGVPGIPAAPPPQVVGVASPWISDPGREREAILAAMRQYGGRRKAVAAALGISPTTLWRRMKKHGIAEDYR